MMARIIFQVLPLGVWGILLGVLVETGADLREWASLGLGGLIAFMVLTWKRADDKAYSDALSKHAGQLLELNKMTLDLFSKNTAALAEVTSAIRSLKVLDRLERRIDSLGLSLSGDDITESHP